MDYIPYNDGLTIRCRQLLVAILNSVALSLAQCATLFNVANPDSKIAHKKTGSQQISAGDFQKEPGFSTDATIEDSADPRSQLRESTSVSNVQHVETTMSTNRYRDALLNLGDTSSSTPEC